MKNVIFTLFTLALAGIAAIAATTAMLNAPVVHNIGAPKSDQPAGATPPGTPPATPPNTPPATPAETPPATPPSGGQPAPAPSTGGAATPAGAAGGDASSDEPESDKDPYEGIAPEDLPPDLQYDADSSVSFPTNT